MHLSHQSPDDNDPDDDDLLPEELDDELLELDLDDIPAMSIDAGSAPLSDMTPEQLEGLEAIFSKYHSLSDHPEDESSMLLTSLEECPEGKDPLYVRVLRYSHQQVRRGQMAWLVVIQREHQLIFNWIRQNLNPNVQWQEIRVIIVMRGALVTLASLQDTVNNLVLPFNNRPGRLLDLRAANRIRALIITSLAGFLTNDGQFRSFLLGTFNGANPCIPNFPIIVLPFINPGAVWQIDASTILRPKQDLDDAEAALRAKFELGTLRARVFRYLLAFGQRLSSQGRNLTGSRAAWARRLSPSELSSFEQGIASALRIQWPALLPLSHVKSIIRPQCSATVLRRDYRLIRFSCMATQIKRSQIFHDKDAFLQEQRGAYGFTVDRRPRQLLMFDGSAIQDTQSLGNAASHPPNAMACFIAAWRSGRVTSLSLTSPDGLLAEPAELQRFLLAGSDWDVPITIESPMWPAMTVGSRRLLLYLSGDHAADPAYAEVLHFLREARLSRWSIVLARRISGDDFRNRQYSRSIPRPPDTAWATVQDPATGKKRYSCRMCSKAQNMYSVSSDASGLALTDM